MRTLFDESVIAIGLFLAHSFVKSSIRVACSVESMFSHCFSTAVATTLPPEILTFPAAVSPLSPNAETSPPDILISVSACIASLPAFIDKMPPSTEIVPLEDLIPSPFDDIIIFPPLTVTELLPFTASGAASASSLRVLI